MKLNAKIFSMLLVLIIFTIAAVLISVLTMRNMDEKFRFFAEKDATFLSNYKDIYAFGLQRGQAVRNVLLNPKDAKGLENFKAAVSDSENLLVTLVKTAPDEGLDPAKIIEIQNLTAKDIDLQKKAVDFASSDPAQALKIIIEQETPVWRDIKTKYFDMEKVVHEMFSNNSAQIRRTLNFNENMMYVVVALFLIFSAAILVYIRRAIIRPIVQSSIQVNRIAQGDLTVKPLPDRSKDEIGDLGRSLNELVRDWGHLVKEVKQTALQVSASSELLTTVSRETTQAVGQVSGAVVSLATGTETQLRSTEECGRTIEEMSVGIQRIAESSGGASEFAAKAASQSNRGQSAIDRMLEQMGFIRDSVGDTSVEIRTLEERSEEISFIVSTIKDISTQTKLLALNASIEAARAGDSGRGFAVVASEVRKLAEQTQTSAEQIHALVSSVQEKTKNASIAIERGLVDVKSGGVIVDEVREMFIRILSDSKDVSEQIQEISAATQQMSACSQEVTASMEQITSISKDSSESAREAATSSQQQLAAMEDVASSARTLNGMATTLQELVSRFSA